MKYNELVEQIKKQLKTQTPSAIIDIIADSKQKVLECGIRLENEGLVVRDLKGNILPHPAIKIQNEQNKVIGDLVSKYKKF